MTQHPHDKTSDVEHGLVRTDAQEGGARVGAVTEAQRRGSRHRDGSPRAGRKGGGELSMVPEAEFSSYYGRPIVKPAPWEHDIAAYLFSGGLAAGSSLLAAGADLTDRPALR
ncbi:MAG: nitrite reductase, partial [Actinomycetes bacterium]